MTMAKCKSCEGRGYVVCPKCKGKGEIKRISLLKGLDLTQQGAVVTDECSLCSGSGRKECGACKGSGER
jgi:RecJ-like exonuclease